ncbi:MAG: leucyl aminopeptidase family protein, partial [Paracoccaceae bacterium]|nr:leucyl aminopeptidase family protein [Paracoccaceae bacterium]
MPPTFAPADAASLPLHVVAKEGLADWLATLTGPAATWAAETGFAAAAGEVVLLPDGAGKPCAAAIGLGDATARGRTRFTVAKAVAALPGGVWHLDGLTGTEDRTEAALGWLLGTYRFDRYRKAGAAKARLKAPEGVDAARLEAIAAGEFLTRDLINTPASDMGPAELEQAFADLADRFGATWQATRGEDLLAANFPMIHAVGRAAASAPRLLDMRWGTAGPRLTLVGKGVCFDTGGLDIKPSSGMLLMKKDMGGAATVMGLAQMIMALTLPVRLRVLVPAVENAIAGNAMRPRDILTSRKGLTVEVNNTDAEGRLVLADALTLADEETPDLIVSMATLTGAARVAVGPDLAPFYTDDDGHAAAVSAAGAEVRDPVWRMPFWAPYDSLIEPGIADLDNAPSGGMAGSITAA